MGKITREEITRQIQNEHVKYISLQFSDILGTVKSVEIPVSLLSTALDNKIMFDGSSIEGFVRINEADMFLHPDYDTFLIMNFKGREDTKVARLICDVYKTDGTPFEGDPRYVLKQAIKRMEDLGFSKFNVGFEAEFYLLKMGPDGNPTLNFSDHGSYFDLAPIDGSEDCRRDIVLTLENLGFKMQQSHHEVGPGQNEINFKYADVLTACDSVQTYKIVVKQIARKYGLYATFMPKPVEGFPGSGMHTNCSLAKAGNENIFSDASDPLHLSETCRRFITGVLEHCKGFTAVTNPTINSYKRLVSGYEAPCYIAWASANRSTMIRIPSVADEGARRIEIRSVDSSANPYLATAVILTAGLDGIEHCEKTVATIKENLFKLNSDEINDKHIERLPESLEEALKNLQKDKVIMECLGNHVASKFITAKTCECDKYRKQISQWEIDYYLPKL